MKTKEAYIIEAEIQDKHTKYVVIGASPKEAIIKLLKALPVEINAVFNINIADHNVKVLIEEDLTSVEPAAVCSVEDTKKLYDLYLLDCGSSKLQMVKTVKELTGLGLKESKELCDLAPRAMVLADSSLEQVRTWSSILEQWSAKTKITESPSQY